MTSKTKLATLAISVALILSAAVATYLFYKRSETHHTEDQESRFMQSIQQPMLLVYDNGIASRKSGSLANLYQASMFDMDKSDTSSLINAIAYSPLKNDSEAAASAQRVRLKISRMGYFITKSTYTRLSGNAKSNVNDDTLSRLVREINDEIDFLKRKFSEIKRESPASESPDSPEYFLMEINGRLKQYATVINSLHSSEWKSGFVEKNLVKKELAAIIDQGSRVFDELKSVEDALDDNLTSITESDKAGPQNNASESIDLLSLRFQVLGQIYHALLLPYFEDRVGRDDIAAISWDLNGLFQEIEEIVANSPSIPVSENSSKIDRQLGSFSAELVDFIQPRMNEQKEKDKNQRIASLFEDNNGLILLSKENHDHLESSLKNVDPKLPTVVDNFWQAAFLSQQSKNGEKPVRAQEALLKVFGAPELSSLEVASDKKTIAIDLATRVKGFNIRGVIPTTPEKSAEDKLTLEKSMPIIAFNLSGNELSFIGIVFTSQKLAHANAKIKIPISFDEKEIKSWHASLIKREAAERLSAKKKEEEAEKEAAEQHKEREQALLQDPVYRYTNNLIAQLNPLPHCVALAQTMRNISSSDAPAHVRQMQVEAIFNKLPDRCIR